MCCSCNETYTIFSLSFVVAEPVENNMEMYHAIANCLFKNKVISNINVAKNRALTEDGKNLFCFELHLSNTNHAEALTLENVQKALADLTAQFPGYSDMQIKPHVHVHA
ncbi:hypothetical protein [Azotosporobacter soli]|uniref:hypothetical protein n=1 Tax=Azotosporobacter soli TaxID=3055040 RepID=UPI0031FEDCCC